MAGTNSITNTRVVVMFIHLVVVRIAKRVRSQEPQNIKYKFYWMLRSWNDNHSHIRYFNPLDVQVLEVLLKAKSVLRLDGIVNLLI